MPRGHGKPTDSGYVPGQGKPQIPRGKIPYLYSAIAGAAGEPLVVRLNGQSPDPAQMTGDDSHQLPRGMPLGLDLVRGLSASGAQGLGLGRCMWRAGAGWRSADLNESGRPRGRRLLCYALDKLLGLLIVGGSGRNGFAGGWFLGPLACADRVGLFLSQRGRQGLEILILCVKSYGQGIFFALQVDGVLRELELLPGRFGWDAGEEQFGPFRVLQGEGREVGIGDLHSVLLRLSQLKMMRPVLLSRM